MLEDIIDWLLLIRRWYGDARHFNVKYSESVTPAYQAALPLVGHSKIRAYAYLFTGDAANASEQTLFDILAASARDIGYEALQSALTAVSGLITTALAALIVLAALAAHLTCCCW